MGRWALKHVYPEYMLGAYSSDEFVYLGDSSIFVAVLHVPYLVLGKYKGVSGFLQISK